MCHVVEKTRALGRPETGRLNGSLAVFKSARGLGQQSFSSTLSAPLMGSTYRRQHARDTFGLFPYAGPAPGQLYRRPSIPTPGDDGSSEDADPIHGGPHDTGPHEANPTCPLPPKPSSDVNPTRTTRLCFKPELPKVLPFGSSMMRQKLLLVLYKCFFAR